MRFGLKLLLSIFSFWLCSTELFAQFNFDYDNSIPVIRSGQPLKNAWEGGFNCAQVSDFDFDFDGDLDLFIFDRSRDNIRVLVQEQNMGVPYYRMFYNAKLYFPDDLFYRAQLVDYDNDGRKDIFTYGIGGLKVYRNTGSAMSGPQWELVSDLVYSQYPTIYTNLYVSSADIPAIVDVDFDGDIDILTFHQGGQHLEYHQNQSMELYGVPDSLKFELRNECWGKFTEEFSTNVLTLNDPNSPCSGGAIPNPERSAMQQHKPKHAGSTVLAMDYDNSGVMDLILSDIAYPNLTLLINGGSAPNTDSPMISQDNNFPSNTTPVDLQLFPASFYVDVDFDGIKDLVVSPNAKNISENVASIRFYKNIGSNSNPTFTFVSNNLFQGQMIEHGFGSMPVFHDYDQDGLMDLFVANFFRYKPVLDRESTLAYYKNTGTPTAPQFTFVDNNFLNLNSMGMGLRLVPTFGDIDNDNDPDLFIGLDNGTLAYFQNNGTVGSPNYAAPVFNYTDVSSNIITVGSYAFPQLFDLNKDNKLDLIIGRKNGFISYYENTGTINSPQFTKVTDSLGMVDVSMSIPDGYATPHFFRVGDTTKLFIGQYDGNILLYDSVDFHIAHGDTFRLVSGQFSGINVEGYSSIAVHDIDNDGQLNAFVGQDLGGLFAFESNPSSTASLEEQKVERKWICFPNPSAGNFQIEAEKEISRYWIFDLNGQLIQSEAVGKHQHIINASEMSQGVYILKFELDGSEVITSRIIKN